MPKVSHLFKMCTDCNAFREFGNNNCINTDSSVALKLTFERKLNFHLLHRSQTLEERHIMKNLVKFIKKTNFLSMSMVKSQLKRCKGTPINFIFFFYVSIIFNDKIYNLQLI